MRNNVSFQYNTGSHYRAYAVLLALLVGVCYNSGVLAQASPPEHSALDFKQVVRQMQEQYNHAEKMHIVMEIKVFQDEAASTLLYTDRVEIQKIGHNYHYHTSAQDMLLNDKYLILINRKSKEIFCNKRNLKSELQFNKDYAKMDLDSILSFYGTPVYKGKAGRDDKFELSLKEGDIASMDIYITENRLINKLVYHYRQGMYADIDFKVFDVDPDFAPGILDEHIYVSISKDGVGPSKRFAGYQVVNVEAED